MVDASDDRVVVYRGSNATALDLLEAMLAAEGFDPRRLGRASAPLLGAGESAVLQLLTVPAEHAESARALLDASRSASEDPSDVGDLETQALQATPSPDTSAALLKGPSVRLLTLLVLTFGLVYLWLHG